MSIFSLFIPENVPEFQHVYVHSNVTVPCPSFTAEEMTFTLHKNTNQVASFIYANMARLKSQELLGSTVKHHVNNDNTTCFVLYNVSKNETALYTCRAEKSYPPPAEQIPEKPQTIVIVEGL